MSRKMRIKGDLQVDGSILGPNGEPISSGGVAIGAAVFRTDLAGYVVTNGDELTPLTIDKPFIVQANFLHHIAPSQVQVGSYHGFAGAEVFTDGDDELTYSVSIILAPNETYYALRTGGDATLTSIMERPLA